MIIPQIITRLKMSTTTEIKRNVIANAVPTTDDPNIFDATIKLSPHVLMKFRELGITLPPLVGKARYRGSPKLAIQEAYKDALDTFEKAGITETWVRENKRRLEFMYPPELQQLYPQLLNKAKKAGYIDIDIQKSTTMVTREVTAVILAGITADEAIVNLVTGVGPNLESAKLDAARKYLK